MVKHGLTAHRGRLFHCLKDPGTNGDADAFEYFDDGVLLIEGGKIVECGPSAVLAKYSKETTRVVEHHDDLIMPGMVDCHIHYPQLDIIASYGKQLLDWLEEYTFPEEQRYSDPAVANSAAEFFVNELLRNGTTTALVFATVHRQSVDAIFSAAEARNMRLAAGKVLMDRHCPEALRDTAESGYRESRELLEKWHGQGRLHYAITPRFALTSSDAQLAAAGKLATEFPDALVHTHLAENPDELARVAELFPSHESYLNVYKNSGLLRERSVFAHCIHLEEHEYQDLSKAGAAIAFCPTSNLFLGSGLFDLGRTKAHGIRTGLGTDVGGGNSFSLLRTLSEAYKVLQLQRQSLSSLRGIYLATLGGAEALYMNDVIGNFIQGKDADFVVLSSNPTELLERRLARCSDVKEELFAHMMLGDDRSVQATYVMGECVYSPAAK